MKNGAALSLTPTGRGCVRSERSPLPLGGRRHGRFPVQRAGGKNDEQDKQEEIKAADSQHWTAKIKSATAESDHEEGQNNE